MGGSNSKGSSSKEANIIKVVKRDARRGVVVPEDVTKVLLDAIENHEKTPAFDIIKANFTPDKPYCIDSFLTGKPTLLYLACDVLNDDLIVFLLEEMKADPNPCIYGSRGKHVLAEMMMRSYRNVNGCVAGAKALARAGADPNTAGFAGATPYTEVLATFKTAPLAREMLMVLATKDGLITDMSTIPVPTACLQNQILMEVDNIADGKLYMHKANPLHWAVACENVIGALVMLELGVDPTAKTSDEGADNDAMTAQDILKKFVVYDQALYDTIQIIIDDRTLAKKATGIYDGLVAKAAAAKAE